MKCPAGYSCIDTDICKNTIDNTILTHIPTKSPEEYTLGEKFDSRICDKQTCYESCEVFKILKNEVIARCSPKLRPEYTENGVPIIRQGQVAKLKDFPSSLSVYIEPNSQLVLGGITMDILGFNGINPSSRSVNFRLTGAYSAKPIDGIASTTNRRPYPIGLSEYAQIWVELSSTELPLLRIMKEQR